MVNYMTEFLIILRNEAKISEFNEVSKLIESEGGKITLRFPPRVIIGQMGEDSLEKLRSIRGVIGVFTSKVQRPADLGLDEGGLLAVTAWNQRLSEEYRASKSERPDEGKSWDYYEKRPGGDVLPTEDSKFPSTIEALGAKSVPINTSKYMIGTVAVGVVIVDGPGSASFTSAERTNIVAEVQEGVNGLIGLAPVGAHLNFVFDVNTVTLTLDPNQVTGNNDEYIWRDAAMAKLGYSSGSSGMYDYLHYLKTTKWPSMCPGPDWAYIAFFTKYATWWFAYASVGGPRLVMQYSNNGWGSNQIDRVFAHESGHIFNAPDEYASSNCSVGGSYGYLGVPNGNCAVNNPNSIDCIMKANTYNVCQWTRGHFGWRDTDNDGIPDPIDLSLGTYKADVGITSGNPFWNNSNLWVRNQDDGEGQQSHQNPRTDKENFIYAKVCNFGGAVAEITRVRFYLARYTGTEFIFPNDYTNLITVSDTPCPTVFSLGPGGEAIAKVHLQKAQIPPSTWHPCLLVHVESAQDQPVPTGSHVWDSNNLAQKNLVVEYTSPSQTLNIPIALQNATSKKPFFEFRKIATPHNMVLEMQFQNPKLKPQIISNEITVVKPEIMVKPEIEVMKPVIVAMRAQEIEKKDNISLSFPQDTDFSLHLPNYQDLFFHVALGSSIAFGKRPQVSEPKEEVEIAAPFTRWDRTILPISTKETTKFKLDLAQGGFEPAGINITAPSDARIGDEYVSSSNLMGFQSQEKYNSCSIHPYSNFGG